MAAEVILNGDGAFATLEKPKGEKARPGVPDPTKEAELDWVVVQIAYSPTGHLTTLQELRGWWWTDSGSYFEVDRDSRRTRVVTMTDNGASEEYDSSEM